MWLKRDMLIKGVNNPAIKNVFAIYVFFAENGDECNNQIMNL